MSVNKAILVGRLGKDPELKYTPSGKSVCNFSLATSNKYEDNEYTVWHNIVAWGKLAELCKEYLSKGREVYIEGRIDNRSYEKKDGTKGYISEVVVQNVQFVGSRGDSQGDTKPETGKDDDGLPF